MQVERLTWRQVIESAAEASYEARRVKTGSKPWAERSGDDQRRYREAIAGAFEHLGTIGYAIKPAGPDGVVPGMVTLSLADARALQNALVRADASRDDTLRAYAALQSAISAAGEAAAPNLDPAK